MCGILGFFPSNGLNSERLRESLNQMSKRGPDDEGYACLERKESYLGPNSDMKVKGSEQSYLPQTELPDINSTKWLAHRRLKINGDFRSHQPMNFENYWITYEGEIFNQEEVRAKLKEEGYEFETDGDTEVILKAFIAWRKDINRHLVGMFACGIYNESKDEIYCITDSLGKKPLYYYQDENSFFFSSQIKPILQLPSVNKEICPRKVADYLKYDVVDDGEQTMFKNIKKIPRCSIATFDGEKLSIESIPHTDKKGENIKSEVKKAIGIRTKNKENLAIAISGGLDSTIVGTEVGDEADYYFISFPNTSFDESEDVDAIEEKEDIQVNRISVTGKDLFDEIEKSIGDLEEPASTTVAQAYNILARAASEDGNKILATGSGSDDIFCGYNINIDYLASDLIRKGKFLEAGKLLIDFRHKFSLMRAANTLSLLLPKQIRDYLRESIQYRRRDWVVTPENYQMPEVIETTKDFEKRIMMGIYQDKIPNVLRFGTKVTASHSLEQRSVFLDRPLINTILSKGLKKNLSGGRTKAMLNTAFKNDIPEEISEKRTKTGFVKELHELVNEDVEDKFSDIIYDERFESRPCIDSEIVREKFERGGLNSHEIYRIWSYEIWMREFFD